MILCDHQFLCFCRDKLGTSVQIEHLSAKTLYTKKSFAIISPIQYYSYVEDYMVPLGYEIDILPETLGKIFIFS